MPYFIPLTVGFIGTAVYCFSFQQKKRKNIIFLNVISRLLFILQYLLLGAFAGAILDVLGALASYIAGKKDVAFIQKHLKFIIVLLDVAIVAAGVILAVVNHSWLDLIPVVAVLLHTGSFWLSRESTIRVVYLIGCPFWLVYNFMTAAYGSMAGDLLSMGSIIIAMIRYRKKPIAEKEDAHV